MRLGEPQSFPGFYREEFIRNFVSRFKEDTWNIDIWRADGKLWVARIEGMDSEAVAEMKAAALVPSQRRAIGHKEIINPLKEEDKWRREVVLPGWKMKPRATKYGWETARVGDGKHIAATRIDLVRWIVHAMLLRRLPYEFEIERLPDAPDGKLPQWYVRRIA